MSEYILMDQSSSKSQFQLGDRVVKNPATWTPNEFDSWGRGVGVGVVVEPPFPLEPDSVDVRWPAGRCFEPTLSLLPAPPEWPSAMLTT